MYQLIFDFMTPRGVPDCEPRPCRSCTVVGKYHFADCTQCRKEERQNAKRRYWTATGRDRNGQPLTEPKAVSGSKA